MEAKPQLAGSALKLALLLLVLAVAFYCFSLLEIWDCGICGNPTVKGFGACPYCEGTGKQNLIQRGRAAAGYRGGPWLQDR
jgi:hypothetical protein